MTTMRLERDDEYMHRIEDVEHFNESMYFNVFDPEQQIGGWFRLGNRPNEGYAEMTTCLYLPDGPVAFMYQRPGIDSNDAFDAGGMRFDVEEPLERLRVRYEGPVCVLTDPFEMADPGRAFRNNPHERCVVDLSYRGLVAPDGGEPVDESGEPIQEDLDQAFFRGHYEQHVAATGTIQVGSRQYAVDGHGHRDHSWGPRYWQSPWWYRWLTMNFGPDEGYMVFVRGHRDGTVTSEGLVLRDGEYQPIREASIETKWSEPDAYHEKLTVHARTDGEELTIEGSVIAAIPLRNRRNGPDGEPQVTRITEGLTEWRRDGAVGYGMSEYLDQIVGGQPVGLDA